MFYFSVYRADALDASFTSHYVNIVDAISTSSSSSTMSSSRTTSHTPTAFEIPTSTTNTATFTSVSIPLITPSSTTSASPRQELSGGIIAGIAVGSTLGTLCSVVIACWCVWKAVKRKRTQAFTTEGAGRQQRRGSIWKGWWAGPSGRSSSPYEPYELPNNQISELDSSSRRQNSYGR